ncbi:hypothetical protein [Kitasatospora phosalacinea]|uniref:Uncharacterized protein n=1 Tax=Kitasatospora phosalacinea TaxID=2065 RepID=A0ABW6GEL9_9ACTN
MSERDAAARPGVVPGGRGTAGTMFAALYGGFVPHPWDGPESEHDAYQLFHRRSLAMGWLDERAGGGGPGLWAMNDAGRGHSLAARGAGPVSWFQVEAAAVAGDRPLPAQPFLRCAQEVTERAGVLRLTAVQLLLPLRAAGTAQAVPSLRTADWFAVGGPGARAAVRVRVDGGSDPVLAEVAERLLGDFGALDQDVFTGGVDDRASADGFPAPPFDDRFWNGPPRYGVTLSGELAQWSGEAVGWLAATLADCAARRGVRGPLLFTAVRHGAVFR